MVVTVRVARFFLVQNTKTGKNIPNNHKINQIEMKYFQRPLNRPNGDKIYQDFPYQDPPKFTQMGILGLETNHLATLVTLHMYHTAQRFVHFASRHLPS
jgi:hypothetical protein